MYLAHTNNVGEEEFFGPFDSVHEEYRTEHDITFRCFDFKGLTEEYGRLITVHNGFSVLPDNYLENE